MAHLDHIIGLFTEIRKQVVRKKPATAELVAFAKILELDGLLQQNQDTNYQEWVKKYLSLLLKTNEDRQAILDYLKEAVQ